jgi:hypothetical protein
MGPIHNAFAFQLDGDKLEDTMTLVAEAAISDSNGRRAYRHSWAQLELQAASGTRHTAYMDCTAAQFGMCPSPSGVHFWVEGYPKGEAYKPYGSIPLFHLDDPGRPFPITITVQLDPLTVQDQHYLFHALIPALEGRPAYEGEGHITLFDPKPFLHKLVV